MPKPPARDADIQKGLASELYSAMTELRLNQAEMARELGVTQISISLWLSGKPAMHPFMLHRAIHDLMVHGPIFPRRRRTPRSQAEVSRDMMDRENERQKARYEQRGRYAPRFRRAYSVDLSEFNMQEMREEANKVAREAADRIIEANRDRLGDFAEKLSKIPVKDFIG